MHPVEKALAKASHKVAKWYPEKCRFQVLPNGFLLQLHGDSEFTPAIGVVDGQVVGALDAYDEFLSVLGYECQIERVLFDADRARFILDAGWSGKYWRKPDADDLKSGNFAVDAMATRMPVKTAAQAIILIAVVAKESYRKPLRSAKALVKKAAKVFSNSKKGG